MKKLSDKNRGVHFLIIGILLLICQGFQCGDQKKNEIYIGGIVRDFLSREPVSGIEVRLEEGMQTVKTDEAGKFGFKDMAQDNYRLLFRDKRGDEKRLYVGLDTLVKPHNDKILVDILLRKK